MGAEQRRETTGSTGPGDGEPLAGSTYLDGSCIVLALTGEIDAGSAPEFRRRLEEAIDQQRNRVVVDMAKVTFMDLAAVGELVQAMRRTGWHKGSICLSAPRPVVRSVLEMMDVASVCPVFDTLELALSTARR